MREIWCEARQASGKCQKNTPHNQSLTYRVKPALAAPMELQKGENYNGGDIQLCTHTQQPTTFPINSLNSARVLPDENIKNHDGMTCHS